MGMNPESNEFEMLKDSQELRDFVYRFYRREAAAGDDIPIFKMGERITIRGYVFEVVQISEDQLALRPIEKALGPKDDPWRDESDRLRAERDQLIQQIRGANQDSPFNPNDD